MTRKNCTLRSTESININKDINHLHSFLLEKLKERRLLFDIGGISTTAIIANPIDFSLFDLRRSILECLDDQKRLSRDHLMEELAWITILRFKTEPNEEFLNFITKNRYKNFGIFVPKSIELFRTKSKIFDKSWERIFSIDL
jgi:hypothetical protein